MAGGYLWLLGAASSVVGSVCSNFGVNIQKYAFMKNQDKPQSQQVPYYKMGGWVLGLALVILGSLGDFVALGLAAQSIVAPIGSITLVANIFFAHFWLKEELSRTDIYGTMCIICGSCLAVAFGDHSEQKITVDILIDNYSQVPFIVYAVFFSIVVMVLYGVIKVVEPIKSKMMLSENAYDKALDSGDIAAQLTEDHILSILEEEYKKYEKIHPFSYCCISGIFGGQNILFGKMVAELMGASFDGDNQMTNGLTYVFLLCMFVSIFTQLHFLAKALNWFDALYVVPVFQCFFITVSTIGGATYFNEVDGFDELQWVLFPLGILITLYGVILLSSRKMSREMVRNTSGLDYEPDEHGRNMLDDRELHDGKKGDEVAMLDDISLSVPSTPGRSNSHMPGRALKRKSVYARQSMGSRPHRTSTLHGASMQTPKNNNFPRTSPASAQVRSPSRSMWKPRGSIMMDQLTMMNKEDITSTPKFMPSFKLGLPADVQHKIERAESFSRSTMASLNEGEGLTFTDSDAEVDKLSARGSARGSVSESKESVQIHTDDDGGDV